MVPLTLAQREIELASRSLNTTISCRGHKFPFGACRTLQLEKASSLTEHRAQPAFRVLSSVIGSARACVASMCCAFALVLEEADGDVEAVGNGVLTATMEDDTHTSATTGLTAKLMMPVVVCWR